MMTRANPLDSLDLAEFETKPVEKKPKQDREEIAKMAEENGFPSREARTEKKATPKAKPPVTGTKKKRRGSTSKTPMEQINVKAPVGLKERFDSKADEMDLPLHEVLSRALDALDAAEGAGKASA